MLKVKTELAFKTSYIDLVLLVLTDLCTKHFNFFNIKPLFLPLYY